MDPTMIIVSVAVAVLIVFAYWHGRLAGFVAKVKADAAAVDRARAAGRLVLLGAPDSVQVPSGVLSKAEGALKKFGDEIAGWAKSKPATAPATAVVADSAGVLKLASNESAVVSPAVVPAQIGEPPAPQPTRAQKLVALKEALDSLIAQEPVV